MMLQLVDSIVCYPARIAEDIPMKIRGYFILVDFVVLDMETTKESPLILGLEKSALISMAKKKSAS
jgi:hypothetical protein